MALVTLKVEGEQGSGKTELLKQIEYTLVNFGFITTRPNASTDTLQIREPLVTLHCLQATGKIVS